MKKIVILHPAFWEQAMGGAELQISYLAKTLQEQGFVIHFIYEDMEKSVLNKFGIILHPLTKIKLNKRFGQPWFLYHTKINRILNEIKPDVIYTRFYSSWNGFAALYSKQNNIKHIWAIASDNDLRRLQVKGSILKPFDLFENFYVRKALINATYIITQNNKQQTDLFEIYKRKGILVNQFGDKVEEMEILKSFEVINILWIANLKPLKRPDLFIELSKNMKHINCLRFIMIGRANSKYHKMLKDASDSIPNFSYIGELDNYDVNEWLKKSHILVNTSDYEGFSNTFVQAWMRKVIVISMNSNPNEILTNEQIGFVCPTLKDLIKKVEYLYKNNDVIIEMAENAYNYSRANHSIDKNLKKVINLMQ